MSNQSHRDHHLVGRSVRFHGTCHPQKEKTTVLFPTTPHQGVFGWKSTKHEARSGEAAGTVVSPPKQQTQNEQEQK